MVKMILFPSSYYNVFHVDDELRQEYEAVLATGMFDTVFFDYEKWFYEKEIVLSRKVTEKRMALYRGWMMKPEQYEEFYHALAENNIELVTNPKEYEWMHLFPNVYEQLKGDTAKMEIYPLYEKMDVEKVKRKFSKFMVKDYVKSVKGTEFPRYFDQEVKQEEFDLWMEVFYRYRGELLTGGICIKEFLNLKYYGNKTNEYRVFYGNHEVISISRNSGQFLYAPLPPQELIEKYSDLNSPYYTVDFAELEDGTWRIVEAGDGSVSGLSENQDYEQYFRALFQCFKVCV